MTEGKSELERAREALERLLSCENSDWIAEAIEALVNAIIDAREVTAFADEAASASAGGGEDILAAFRVQYYAHREPSAWAKERAAIIFTPGNELIACARALDAVRELCVAPAHAAPEAGGDWPGINANVRKWLDETATRAELAEEVEGLYQQHYLDEAENARLMARIAELEREREGACFDYQQADARAAQMKSERDAAIQDAAALREAMKEIIGLADEFRAQMPRDWEGDPLSDACDRYRALTSTENDHART